MLLLAAHTLADIERWWRQHGGKFRSEAEVGDLYRILYRTATEAQAAWSLLRPRPDGSRTFTVGTAPAPMTIQLVEQGSNLIVWDVRIHTI